MSTEENQSSEAKEIQYDDNSGNQRKVIVQVDGAKAELEALKHERNLDTGKVQLCKDFPSLSTDIMNAETEENLVEIIEDAINQASAMSKGRSPSKGFVPLNTSSKPNDPFRQTCDTLDDAISTLYEMARTPSKPTYQKANELITEGWKNGLNELQKLHCFTKILDPEPKGLRKNFNWKEHQRYLRQQASQRNQQ